MHYFHIHRTLSADLIAPLPSLQELCIDGNDISIVAKNAFETTDTLAGLSLADNPLSCDCSMRSFAEWMSTSKLSAQVGGIRATSNCISHRPRGP